MMPSKLPSRWPGSRWLVVAALSVLLTSCGRPRHRSYGHYLTCPWPAFSGIHLTLSSSGARLESHGDSGPNSASLTGQFSRSADHLSVTLTAGTYSNPLGTSAVESPMSLTFDVLETAESVPVLVLTSTDSKPADLPIFLVRAARLGEEVPGRAECPAEVEQWRTARTHRW